MMTGLISQQVLVQEASLGASTAAVPLHFPRGKLHRHHIPPFLPSHEDGAWAFPGSALPGALPGSAVPAAAPCPWHEGFHWDAETPLPPWAAAPSPAAWLAPACSRRRAGTAGSSRLSSSPWGDEQAQQDLLQQPTQLFNLQVRLPASALEPPAFTQAKHAQARQGRAEQRGCAAAGPC